MCVWNTFHVFFKAVILNIQQKKKKKDLFWAQPKNYNNFIIVKLL